MEFLTHHSVTDVCDISVFKTSNWHGIQYSWLIQRGLVYSAVPKVEQLTTKRTNELMCALFSTSSLQSPAYLSLVIRCYYAPMTSFNRYNLFLSSALLFLW